MATERQEGQEMPGGERERLKAVLTSSLSPQLSRGKENQPFANIFSKLEIAFGGWNQVPYSAIGNAIVGQVVMRRFGENPDIQILVRGVKNEIDNAVKQICRVRGFGTKKADEAEVRKQIMKGMREKAKEEDKNSEIWAVIDELEIQMN